MEIAVVQDHREKDALCVKILQAVQEYYILCIIRMRYSYKRWFVRRVRKKNHNINFQFRTGNRFEKTRSGFFFPSSIIGVRDIIHNNNNTKRNFINILRHTQSRHVQTKK